MQEHSLGLKTKLARANLWSAGLIHSHGSRGRCLGWWALLKSINELFWDGCWHSIIEIEFMSIQKTRSKGNSGELWHSQKETPEKTILCSSIVTKFLTQAWPWLQASPSLSTDYTRAILPYLISRYTAKSSKQKLI